MAEPKYRLPDVQKDPAEALKVTLNLFYACANLWQRNEAYSLTDMIRPTRATGYAYECTNAGSSGNREPIWPRTLGSTVTDGSVTWTCRAAGDNGLSALSSPAATSDPTGLTVSDVSVEETTKILATYTGGQLGQDYDAVFTFTLNGVTRVARQRVEIRKR
jgi:hypothetical protein